MIRAILNELQPTFMCLLCCFYLKKSSSKIHSLLLNSFIFHLFYQDAFLRCISSVELFYILLEQHRVWYQMLARNFPIKQYYILLDLPLLTERLGRRNKCPYTCASLSFKAIVHFIGNCLLLTWISTRQRSNNDHCYIYFST